jgi:hypothetical protein
MTGHLHDRADWIAADKQVPAAIETLLDHHRLMPDVLTGDNANTLYWLLYAWQQRPPNDPVWDAATELFCSAMPGNEFDGDIVKGVVELLAAAADGFMEVDEGQARLTLATYERMRQAHRRIGDVLDAVRRDEVARRAS